MANYGELFPNIYVDASQNLQIDSNSVSISSNSLAVTPTSITSNQVFTFTQPTQYENNIFLKNQLVSDGETVPAGSVAIGFDRGIPFFSSPDFASGAKYVDARALIPTTVDVQLGLNDEFVLLGGTNVDPIIVTLPTNPYQNSRVYYLGGIGSFYGQINSGNVDIVVYDQLGSEIGRDNFMVLNQGKNLTFTYSVISTDPFDDQWSVGIDV